MERVQQHTREGANRARCRPPTLGEQAQDAGARALDPAPLNISDLVGHSAPMPFRPSDLLALQRTVGNRAVSEIVRNCAAPGVDWSGVSARRFVQRTIDEATAEALLGRGKSPAQKKWDKKPKKSMAADVIDYSRYYAQKIKNKEDVTPRHATRLLEDLHRAVVVVRDNVTKKDVERKGELESYLSEIESEAAEWYAKLYSAKSGGKESEEEEKKEGEPSEKPVLSSSNIQTLDDLFTSPSEAEEGKTRIRPTIEDVRQGSIGDCFLLAALIALVHGPAGAGYGGSNPVAPLFQRVMRKTTLIHKPMLGTYEPDPNKPAIVEVRLFRKIGIAKFEPVLVQAVVGGKGAEAGYDRAPWPKVIEAAYAKVFNGYADLEGGRAYEALEILLGSHAKIQGEKDEKLTVKWLREQYETGKLVTVGTKKSTKGGGDRDMVPTKLGEEISLEHAYAVIGFKGKDIVILRNPHGKTHEITDADLKKYFDEQSTAALLG